MDYRTEYPRPSMVREKWLCLNGKWGFEIDSGDSGLERGLVDAELSAEIKVPFCPESELSGVGNTDFLNAVWYRKSFTVPDDWGDSVILLHFQAVDYDSTVWVNGRQLVRHRGGFTPFTAIIKDAAAGDELTIVVRARDDHRNLAPKGKQCHEHDNFGCLYTRTTGIWQSVWAEPVSRRAYFQRPRITPDVANSSFNITTPITGNRPGLSIKAAIRDDAGVIAEKTLPVVDFQPSVSLSIPEDRVKLWHVGEGNLYDIKLELIDANGEVIDSVDTYGGLRSIQIDGMAVKINGQSVFQRLVLDQGYYPGGIMTAPSEQALIDDIKLSIAAGFNGARLHQKVFEERFLYHADRLGYLVWGEFGDWGSGVYYRANQQVDTQWVTQWIEVLHRDYSHPSIIGWCPLNEKIYNLTDRISDYDDVINAAFLATKAMDQTRPVLDTSGYSHRVAESDIWDCHDYQQDPEKFRENHEAIADNKVFRNDTARGCMWDVDYNGQPFFVSEFGGAKWNPESAVDGKQSWGYGDNPKTLEEFYQRFEDLCGVLLDNPAMFGYCYTQLTDVFQEQNGIYGFDRSEKFDMEKIRAAQIKKAAIEY